MNIKKTVFNVLVLELKLWDAERARDGKKSPCCCRDDKDEHGKTVGEKIAAVCGENFARLVMGVARLSFYAHGVDGVTPDASLALNPSDHTNICIRLNAVIPVLEWLGRTSAESVLVLEE